MFSFLFGSGATVTPTTTTVTPTTTTVTPTTTSLDVAMPQQTQDYILLIMNCKQYADKRAHQRSTWLKELPPWLPYYHVIGNADLPTPYIFNDNDRILYVKTADDYNSLPQKVIAAYMAINAIFVFKYIFKTDDDQTTIQPPSKIFGTLKACLEYQNPAPNYGGFIVDVKTDHISQYYRIHKELPTDVIVRAGKYCNGRFYILSAAAVRDLALKADQFRNEYFEDYAVGHILDNALREPIFKIDTGKNFRDT